MFVRRRRWNSLKLLLWFLFQQPQALAQLIVGAGAMKRPWDYLRESVYKDEGAVNFHGSKSEGDGVRDL
jgi:hypothetical protein